MDYGICFPTPNVNCSNIPVLFYIIPDEKATIIFMKAKNSFS